VDARQMLTLRQVITENLRVQRGGAKPIEYVDPGHVLSDMTALQNHVVFGRRGCGKSLLLHASSLKAGPSVRCVYLNCEDFKNHSFPNVLIEILDGVFAELESHVDGWFGKKKRCRVALQAVRSDLESLRQKADEREVNVKKRESQEGSSTTSAGADLAKVIKLKYAAAKSRKEEVELEYQRSDSKVRDLSLKIPEFKRQISKVFEVSNDVKHVFIQLDDFYHIQRAVQPHVTDYIHRICKDVPLFFKIATLRHASTLYADRSGQPTGAQERHDYQPIDIDYNLGNFTRTADQIQQIFHRFCAFANLNSVEFDSLFMGVGFERLVLAGGGVPRDCLSLFLEAAESASQRDGRIGKDDVRILSRVNLEHRIEELKADSEESEQDSLLRGIYAFRQFCLEHKNNVFLVPEKVLQQHDVVRHLLYRLMDYRIVHIVATAVTHKSYSGTYQAFVIDVGCYAHLRKLQGRFTEIDISSTNAKERIRTGPVVTEELLLAQWQAAPKDVTEALLDEDAG
jgi:hypothetical protein